MTNDVAHFFPWISGLRNTEGQFGQPTLANEPTSVVCFVYGHRNCRIVVKSNCIIVFMSVFVLIGYLLM